MAGALSGAPAVQIGLGAIAGDDLCSMAEFAEVASYSTLTTAIAVRAFDLIHVIWGVAVGFGLRDLARSATVRTEIAGQARLAATVAVGAVDFVELFSVIGVGLLPADDA